MKSETITNHFDIFELFSSLLLARALKTLLARGPRVVAWLLLLLLLFLTACCMISDQSLGCEQYSFQGHVCVCFLHACIQDVFPVEGLTTGVTSCSRCFRLLPTACCCCLSPLRPWKIENCGRSWPISAVHDLRPGSSWTVLDRSQFRRVLTVTSPLTATSYVSSFKDYPVRSFQDRSSSTQLVELLLPFDLSERMLQDLRSVFYCHSLFGSLGNLSSLFGTACM